MTVRKTNRLPPETLALGIGRGLLDAQTPGDADCWANEAQEAM